MNDTAESVARQMAAVRRSVQMLAERVGFVGISTAKGIDSLNAVLDDLTRAVGFGLANTDDTLDFGKFLEAAGASFYKSREG